MIPLSESSEVIARSMGITPDDLKNKAKYDYWTYRKRIAWILIRKYSGRHVTLREIAEHFSYDFSSIGYGLESGAKLLRKSWHDFTKLFQETELAYLKWIEDHYPDISFKEANNRYKHKPKP